jgi:hypothetical protein
MQTAATKANKKAKFRDPPEEAVETEDDGGKDPDGGKAVSCPGAIASGFEVRLEGMVGSDDSEGGSVTPPGEGNRGVMSGDRAGENRGTPGKTAGAAEIVETFLLGASDANADEDW